MAISNFTQSPTKTRFLASILPWSKRTQHEKKSCWLSSLTPEQLLSINGCCVQVCLHTGFHDQIVTMTGRVLSVLVPCDSGGDSGVLFLANGDSEPDFLNLDRTTLEAVFLG